MILADMRLRCQPFKRDRLCKMLIDDLLDLSAIERAGHRHTAGNFHPQAAADLGKQNIQNAQTDA